MSRDIVRIGDAIQVPNTLRKSFSRAAEVYWAVVVAFKGKPKVILLTRNGMEVALNRAAKNREDWPANAALWVDSLLGK